jgi:hypothetical protein
MRVSVRARAFVVMAASASLLAVPLAMPSSAATAAASCKKLSDTTKGSAITFHVASCTPLAATGGSGSGPVSGTKPGQTSGTLNVTVTWATHHGTTKAAVKFAPAAGPGKCPAGTTRLKITGKVTGGSGTAFKTIKTGQPVSASVCTNAKTGATSLEPGTTAKF